MDRLTLNTYTCTLLHSVSSVRDEIRNRNASHSTY